MTPDQIKLARHALGLPSDRNRTYRNRYFAAPGTDFEERWDDLVRKGLAERHNDGGRHIVYLLTIAGARLALDKPEVLDPEDFPSPQDGKEARQDG